MNNKTITILGLPLDFSADTTSISENCISFCKPYIQSARVLCAGRSQLDLLQAYFPLDDKETILITADIELLADRLKAYADDGHAILILASGDPLFFGIAASLRHYFSKDNLTIIPSVSSMQEAFSRLALPWHEATHISMHGRRNNDLFGIALMQNKHICILCDEKVSLKSIAEFMEVRGKDYFTIHLFKGLSNFEKKLGSYQSYSVETALSLDEKFALVGKSALIILEHDTKKHPQPFMGIPDASFTYTNNLITKSPVRSAILGSLQLKKDDHLLEIGSGSGSISIEAASILQNGMVYAIERSKERIENIFTNRKRFGVANMEIIEGDAKLVLDSVLKIHHHNDFNAIVIGGGLSGEYEDAEMLLMSATKKLCSGGRLVISCVLLKTFELAREVLTRDDWYDASFSLIQANKAMPLAGDFQFKALNPVFIVSANKR